MISVGIDLDFPCGAQDRNVVQRATIGSEARVSDVDVQTAIELLDEVYAKARESLISELSGPAAERVTVITYLPPQDVGVVQEALFVARRKREAQS